MKFGAVTLKDALGATAVHSIRQGELVLKKGTLIGPVEIAALEAAGIKEVVAARLEPGDVAEDVAAAELAKAVAGEGVHVDRAFTGRANLFAQNAGVLVLDKDAIDRLNRVDEAITFATLPAFRPVVAGEMIATVKIIPFAVSGPARDAALAGLTKPLLRVAPYRVRKVGVVSTVLPGLASKVIEKTLKITAERLAPAGATIIAERRVPHDREAVARAIDEVLKAGAELAIVFGASAIADRRDVIPAALEAIGGRPLVRMVAEAVLASQARPVVVVTGHERERVEATLAGLPVSFVHNPHYAEGLGSSLKAGIAAVPAQADGAVVCLGDMPQVDAALVNRLIAAIDPDKGALVAVPTIDGKRGNPVVWSRRFFPDLMAVEGDVGARHLIGRYGEAVVEVPVTGTGVLTDIDTPEALAALRAELEKT